jgi:hypothetical protein
MYVISTCFIPLFCFFSGFCPRRRGGALSQGATLGRRTTTWKRRLEKGSGEVIFSYYSSLKSFLLHAGTDGMQGRSRSGRESYQELFPRPVSAKNATVPSWRQTKTRRGSIRINVMTPASLSEPNLLVSSSRTWLYPRPGALPSSVGYRKRIEAEHRRKAYV